MPWLAPVTIATESLMRILPYCYVVQIGYGAPIYDTIRTLAGLAVSKLYVLFYESVASVASRMISTTLSGAVSNGV